MAIERKGACRICGKAANTLVNWKILTCGGCKAFYKRTIRNKVRYTCEFGGNCPTMRVQVNKVQCRACRFQKCVSVGLVVKGSKEAISAKSLDAKQFSNKSTAIPTVKAEEPSTSTAGQRSTESLETTNSNKIRKAPHLSPVNSEKRVQQKSNPAAQVSSDHRGRSSESPIPLDASLGPWNDIPLTDELAALHASSFPFSIHPTDIEQPEDSSTSESFDLISANRRLALSLPMVTDYRSLPLGSRYINGLDNSVSYKQQLAITGHAIGAAAHIVFGDQIVQWREHMERTLTHGKKAQPEINLNDMVVVMNDHTGDNVRRNMKFASMMPGMDGVDPTCMIPGWKFLVYNLIHHAPFMSNVETFITVGSQQYQYSRHWQEQLEWQFMAPMYKLCTMFRDIGLDETERYVVLAIVMLEPGEDYTTVECSDLHRYYLDVLLYSIKRRCRDSVEAAGICRRLELFFSVFEQASQLQKVFFPKHQQVCPPCSMKAKQLVLQMQECGTTLEDYRS